jgi:hypothetical protein
LQICKKSFTFEAGVQKHSGHTHITADNCLLRWVIETEVHFLTNVQNLKRKCY